MVFLSDVYEISTKKKKDVVFDDKSEILLIQSTEQNYLALNKENESERVDFDLQLTNESSEVPDVCCDLEKNILIVYSDRDVDELMNNTSVTARIN